MTKQNTKGILSVLLSGLVIFIPTITFASQTDAAEPEQLRWFEVEIILYKATSEQGLQNESWDTNINMQLPDELIDFIQPFGLPAESTADAEQLSMLQKNAKINQQQDRQVDSSGAKNLTGSGIPAKDTEIKNPEFKALDVEQPFVLLEEELLQLKAEALNISRHVNYDLLAHFSWRQPVLSKREATSLRIAGGFNYQHTFEFSGEKKLEIISADESSLLKGAADFSINTELNSNSQQSASEPEPQRAEIDTTDEQESGQPEQLLGALPWVPEIDGSILVYIHRNYLHVDTDLYYRRPGRQEVDIFNFQNLLPPLDTLDTEQEAKTSFLDITQQPINADDFAWQYDGDFLSKEFEKTFTERLFNYPLKQNRRLRSNQLNYFDHPLIGMLVMIRPYEINLEDQSIQEDELVNR